MKRLLIIGVFATVALLIIRARLPKLHERMEARCKAMFEKNASPQPGCCEEPSAEVTRHQTEREHCEQTDARDADRTESVAVA
jgi:hypothetical protein